MEKMYLGGILSKESKKWALNSSLFKGKNWKENKNESLKTIDLSQKNNMEMNSALCNKWITEEALQRCSGGDVF